MLLDCVDILRSITKSCGDNVGGVNKRVWITQLQQIERYTFDSLGYVNSITTKEVGTTNYGYEFKKVISKKGSHSGNVEAIENVNVDVFKHTAILKAYATTPEQRDSLVSLYGASKVVVFFETDNGEIEIYGLENGLYATALTGNTGEQMQDDTAFTFTLSGLQTSLPKYFLYGGTLATSIAYLDNIGIEPIYKVESYTAGTSTIDFTNNGGDDWDIGFKIAMDSEQLPIGQTVDDYDIDVYHYVSGIGTQIEQSTQTTDHTVNTSGNGAGVYSVEQAYNVYDNGNYVSSITMQSLYKVDGTGNLLAYFKGKGITVNSVSGLDINVTANVEQSESYPIEWYSFDGNNAPVLIGTGETLTLTLPLNCLFITAQAVIDSVFTNDCPQSPYNLSSFIIN
jgi:phosphoribosyl-AMP cyclohydrolase